MLMALKLDPFFRNFIEKYLIVIQRPGITPNRNLKSPFRFKQFNSSYLEYLLQEKSMKENPKYVIVAVFPRSRRHMSS